MISSKQKIKIKLNQNSTYCSVLEEKLILDTCLIKSYLYLQESCFAEQNMYQSQKTCYTAEGFEELGRRGLVTTELKQGEQAHAFIHSLSHSCLVQLLHTLVLCSNSLQVPSTHAHTVPSLWWQHVQLALWIIAHQAIHLVCWWVLIV